VTLSVKPAARGPNLDVSARLYNAAGNLLASSNPVDTLDASLSLTIASAGTYYLFVDGIGKGDLSTGYSDYASQGEYTITGTVPLSGSGGQAPVAVAAASVTSGPAPLTVNFSSAGSRDPDGGAITYLWNFGDGSTSSEANPVHTYTTPGTYTATLKVTDPSGATATSQVNNITVTAATAPRVHVAAITMATSTLSSGSWRGRAAVKVVDATGKAVSGAIVSGTWSGIVSGTSSGSTNSTGKVTLTSQWTQAKGTMTFTVNGVNAAGYTYDAGANTVTSGSVTR
jgi:PKD repeat protein